MLIRENKQEFLVIYLCSDVYLDQKLMAERDGRRKQSPHFRRRKQRHVEESLRMGSAVVTSEQDLVELIPILLLYNRRGYCVGCLFSHSQK